MVDATEVPSLSIVIPVYNEPRWIEQSVCDAVAAVRRSPFARDAELVIVDDGSDQATKSVLARLSAGVETRVITQDNQGRFAARQTGIEAAKGDLVLLLDSRVSIRPDSLRFLAPRLANGSAQDVWNAHVDIDVRANPFARFWRTIAHAAWPDYLNNPRTMSYGLEDYDRYPKGTTCFMAPRSLLLEALGEFRSLYEDSRYANDDTVLIRSIAEKRRINISPGFACLYRSRDSTARFLRHSFHRGIVFVDGFGRPGTRFFPFLLAFFPVSAALLVLALVRPRQALRLALAAPMMAALGATAIKRPPRDVLAFSILSGPFSVAYGAGIWRGGLLALKRRLSR